MKFKTLLRKWHTFIGCLILVPTILLSLTGIYLIQNNQPKEALIAAAFCGDDQWIGVSSVGFIGNLINIKNPPFSLTNIAALSCTKDFIDIALDYGAIASTRRDKIRWTFIPRPFDNKIKTIQRDGMTLHVSTQNDLWTFKFDQWKRVQHYPPTLAQRIYEFHAGWHNGKSFEYIWGISSTLLIAVSLSGVWIFIRMIRR
ncbi:MAG: hypothetical protein VW397_00060 [Candidatus Margulisiibacteriota bacterium]